MAFMKSERKFKGKIALSLFLGIMLSIGGIISISGNASAAQTTIISQSFDQQLGIFTWHSGSLNTVPAYSSEHKTSVGHTLSFADYNCYIYTDFPKTDLAGKEYFITYYYHTPSDEPFQMNLQFMNSIMNGQVRSPNIIFSSVGSDHMEIDTNSGVAYTQAVTLNTWYTIIIDVNAAHTQFTILMNSHVLGTFATNGNNNADPDTILIGHIGADVATIGLIDAFSIQIITPDPTPAQISARGLYDTGLMIIILGCGLVFVGFIMNRFKNTD
jgi:hypothetical protein